ncbi:hypothetical protein [uncultured Streptomyces sp.]|uniref:hypothetical protein n=1 Tax=uncultured Streptomyces sp. TaxID=174707 RepID=UPI00263392E6|nr:hypothetical protein [uncultured Streptomyces sp.]
MANPGYGKRSAPGQRPRTASDFTHLAPRDAAVAAYVDRLPDGSDISVKTLARVLPYGQCAIATTLNRLQAAGHLRRARDVEADATMLFWVTRTYFSRTAREDAWWAAFANGDALPEPQRPTRSRAFILLAALGRTAPALSLAERDCVRLEPKVSEWFERGASEPEILRALTAGLPNPVHHAASLVERRLVDKLPPLRVAPPRVVLRTLECGKCGAPGPPEALPGGLCRPCRTPAAPDTPYGTPGTLPSTGVLSTGTLSTGVLSTGTLSTGAPGSVASDGVSSRMNQVRAGMLPREERPRGRAGVTIHRHRRS